MRLKRPDPVLTFLLENQARHRIVFFMAQSASDLFPPSDLKLFEEFPSSSRSAWEQEIARTLEKQGKAGLSLNWALPDGISLPPFLLEEDLAELPFIGDFPGVYPFTRSTQRGGQAWSAQYPLQGDGSLADRLSEAQRRGADGVTLFVGGTFPAVPYGRGRKDAAAALAQSELPVQCVGSTADLVALVGALKSGSVNNAQSSILIDPFSDVLIGGDFALNEADIYGAIKAAFAQLKIPVGAVRADLFHNAGATPALELGLTLSAAADLVSALTESGMSPVDALSCITLFQPVGALYFVEMAKFRATRRLSAMVAKGFGVTSYERPVLAQSAVTSLFNVSLYDPYTNMLRVCTEAMSAVLGGASSVLVLPLDAPFDRDDEFTRRMAINTQLVLRHESYLDSVSDPAGGSYYIEAATDQIAEAAWKIFLEIEAEGGYRKALEKGSVQARLKQAGEQRLDALARRKEIQLGVNQFPNNTEILRDSEYKDASIPALPEAKQGRYASAPIFRGAVPFERLRLQTEEFAKKGHRPFVQLLPFGNLSMQRARAAFIGNFFGCAGFAVNDPGSLETPEACLAFAKEVAAKQKIDAFVLCSADAEYLPAATAIMTELKAIGVPVILAGNPAEVEALKASGIEDFIHVRRNVYETLSEYQKRFCA